MGQNIHELNDSRFRDWFDNRSTPEERARFLLEEEQFWAAVDLAVYAQTFGEPHPNEGMEYEPLVAIKKLRRNY